MSGTMKQSNGYTSTPEEDEFELRAHIGSVWSGGRLFIGMYTFLLASLAFAYFYLRSSNNGLLWRPNHVTAPTAYGWTIVALTVLGALMAIYGQRRLRSGGVVDWQVAGWTALFAAVLALVLQIWELTALSFYPGSSGYASTFMGFAVMNIISLVISVYWLETTVARGMRIRKEVAGENPEFSSNPRARAFRADVAAMAYFQVFLTLAGALLFAMFYLM